LKPRKRAGYRNSPPQGRRTPETGPAPSPQGLPDATTGLTAARPDACTPPDAAGGQSPLAVEGERPYPDRFFTWGGREGDTLLVRRTLRSGQHVGHRGNVVVLGDVNPGAEVVAGGDILVMGSLRGVAHAGAPADDRAVVAGFRLRPTQLRIGNYIARAPDGDITGPEVPEVAHVKEGRVVIRPYHPAGRGRPRS